MPTRIDPRLEQATPHGLIDRLAGQLRPVRRRSPLRDAGLLALIVAVELALFLLMGGMRHDMHRAMDQPSWWWKLASMALIAAAGIGTAVLSLDPSRSPRGGLRLTALVVTGWLLLGWLLDTARYGLGPLVSRLDWPQGLGCVWKMAVLSIPAVLGLSVLLGRGAPADRAGTAWAAGLGGAACGALVFVFRCPSDDPLYIAVWYAVGLGLVSVASRAGLGLVARW